MHLEAEPTSGTDDAPELEEELVDFGDSTGRSFEEKLLLSLIDAHPEPDDVNLGDASRRHNRIKRLKSAMVAVFAREEEDGRPPQNDNRALRWMAMMHDVDLQRQAMARYQGLTVPHLRSIRVLALAAAQHFYGRDDDFERLRSKYRQSRSFWLEVVRTHDDIPESLEANSLEDIAEILHRRGVSMKPANWD